jgi:hypothetical protein
VCLPGEAFRHSVNRDHTPRAEHPAALNGHLRNRTATPHGNSVAGLNFRILRGHVPGREDVREEKDFLVRKIGLDLDWSYIGSWPSTSPFSIPIIKPS